MSEPWFRAAFGAFYPCLYAHRDQAEARRCLERLPQLAPLGNRRGAPVLDLGCGDGRHLGHLAAAGVAAVGLDLSAALLAAARARTPLAPLVLGDMRALPFASSAFAAVLSLFTAFGYFGRREDAAVARDVARVLCPGGHWFLDYLASDRVREELAGGPATRERRAGPLRVTETRRLEPDAVAKDVSLEPAPGQEAAAAAIGVPGAGLRYTERVALYGLDELDDMATSAGMVRVAAAGSYDGAALGSGPRWLLAYRREGDR